MEFVATANTLKPLESEKQLFTLFPFILYGNLSGRRSFFNYQYKNFCEQRLPYSVGNYCCERNGTNNYILYIHNTNTYIYMWLCGSKVEIEFNFCCCCFYILLFVILYIYNSFYADELCTVQPYDNMA